MGAGDASRSDAERREPVRRSARGVDQRGLRWRPKPGQSICPWNAVAPIVADSARLSACFGNCALPALACGLPIRPVLKHGPRSLTCVRVNGQVNPQGARKLTGAIPLEGCNADRP
jgi:hypothetical protein